MNRAGVLAVPRDLLDELAPALRRAATLDAAALVRVRCDGHTVTALLRLPFDVLVARTLRAELPALDSTVRAAELLDWLDGTRAEPPEPRDVDWRAGLPPQRGWRHVETVPDDVLRPLVRSGALALKDAAAREGVPGAQPRAEVADALLDAVVLSATSDDATAEVTLRTVSALLRMGFLPRGGHAHIDVSGRWTRLAAEYGSVYAERAGGLGLL
ncbi:MAG: hypothetical protein ACTHMS_09310 [Jatrophihabitans sp.]|uniref:hypothetical protein n=1 Tax=Jatrophihabitans sp. TaxID=1932789 RepID=UPI003F7DCE89